MPKQSNSISNLKNFKEDNVSSAQRVGKEATEKMTSYSNTREFKKQSEESFMPRMSCPPELVRKFREEAQSKKWKFTTLMTVILEERYGKERE